MASGKPRKGEDPVSRHCALCKYVVKIWGDCRYDCLVGLYKKSRGCGGTPYKRAYRAWANAEILNSAHSEEKKRVACVAELEFLKQVKAALTKKGRWWYLTIPDNKPSAEATCQVQTPKSG
jgi:hypothetical protein